MTRYLMFFSYIGTQFRGSQRQWISKKIKEVDIQTVQGLLEHVLTVTYELPSTISMQVCSRTDAKVHAFINAAHFDMDPPPKVDPKYPFTPQSITKRVNMAIRKLKPIPEVCVLRTVIVPDDFRCRSNVARRSYMYRLAVADEEADISNCARFKYHPLLPLVEQRRCHVVSSTEFNFEAFRAALQLFRGTHNFASFMCSPGKRPEWETCVRHLDVQLVPGKSFMDRHSDPLYEHLQFYEIHFHSKSYLYNQIRKMVGAAISVGYGRMLYEKIRYLLETPNAFIERNCGVDNAPADALFLTNIQYNWIDVLATEKKESQ